MDRNFRSKNKFEILGKFLKCAKNPFLVVFSLKNWILKTFYATDLHKHNFYKQNWNSDSCETYQSSPEFEDEEFKNGKRKMMRLTVQIKIKPKY